MTKHCTMEMGRVGWSVLYGEIGENCDRAFFSSLDEAVAFVKEWLTPIVVKPGDLDGIDVQSIWSGDYRIVRDREDHVYV